MGREWTAEAGEHATFIVRLTRGERGGFSALVERVRTGEKVRVQRAEHSGRAPLRMLEDAAPDRTEVGVRAGTLDPGAVPPATPSRSTVPRRITNAVCTNSPQQEAMP